MLNNETIILFTKNTLKDLLSECDEKQQHIFKRMYSHNDLDAEIDDIVDRIPNDKLDWALSQVERTIEKNRTT